MNSLREEIQETLYNLETDFGNATITNEILKLFEKIIEETYQSDEILGYQGNEDVSYGFNYSMKK